MSAPIREGGRQAAADLSPEVSVVVICYNDSERLPIAVRSVLNQTLTSLEVLIVDDCSTDTTPAVAAELARSDPRVRSIRLPKNSGGCGAPRNTGVSAARGRFIMFLDSDDVFTPDACALLSSAAKVSHADVVSGGLQRVHQSSGAVEIWYQNLYQVERVYEGLREEAELVYDTVSTNKLYSSRFLNEAGLVFPVDQHYEDVVFTAEVFSRAKRIHYVPDQVYEWRVYDDETRRTITNQRSQPSNYSDRESAISRVRAIYRNQELPVRVAADVKALRHHLTLHLRGAPELSDLELMSMLSRFSGFVEGVLPEAIAELTPFERARFAAVVTRDPKALRLSLRDESLGLLSGKMVLREGISLWELPNSRYSPGTTAANFMTFSDDAVLPLPLRPAAVVTSAFVNGRTVTLRGYIEPRGGALPPSGVLSVMDGGAETDRTTCEVATDAVGQVSWEAALTGMRGAGIRHSVPLRLQVRVGETQFPVICAVDDFPALSDSTFLGRCLGDKWEGRRSEDGLLEFDSSPGPIGQLARRAARALS